ncbi:MAG: division/cell wall cluster transcriptional repressor MraZ [Eubacteriales bacterium]
MFMGEYNHTIDAKGRLIMPSKLRESLGEDFVITKGLDGCLFVYDNEGFHAFEEKLKSLPLTNKDARQFVRFFLAGAANVEIDKQGRVLIPAVLREFAEITKEAVLVGVGSRMEIWSKERWMDTTSMEDMETIAEHMAELGLGI